MSKPNRRPLRYESLETRNLLATDAFVPHNFVVPEDCDNSGSVTPLDALVVINELNAPKDSVILDDTKMLDVDADGTVSPLDALVVINHINGKSTVSNVPVESRIERLQLAIANVELPSDMTLEDAQRILDTLRAGGRPELGERVIDGKLHDKEEVIQIETEDAASDLTDPNCTEEHPDRIEQFINRFSTRLKAAGVDAQVITTITEEIKAGIAAEKPLTLDEIKARLTELGVDVSEIFPSPEINVEHLEHEHRLAGLIERLKRADVGVDTINTIVGEVRASIDSGTPLTLEQIKARLTELGVDITKVFPTPNPDNEHPELEHRLAGLIERLKGAGVTVDTINTIVGEIRASIEAGTPLTLDQIKARLTELGVDLTKLFPNVPPQDPPTPPEITLPVELVTAILKRARVPAETIAIVRTALETASKAGAPLTVSKVLEVLKENGVEIPERLVQFFGPRR